MASICIEPLPLTNMAQIKTEQGLFVGLVVEQPKAKKAEEPVVVEEVVEEQPKKPRKKKEAE